MGIEQPRAEGEPATCVLGLKPGPDPEHMLLRLWTPSSVSAPVVTLDGEPLASVDEAEVDDGRFLAVRPTHSGRLRITGTVGSETTELLVLDIELRPHTRHRLKAALDGAMDDPERQDELERQWREQRDATTSALEQLDLTRYLQFLAYDRGRWEESLELALEVAERARVLGRLKDECNSRWSAVYILGDQLGRLDEAMAVLDGGCRYADTLSFATMTDGYYRGLLQLRMGATAEARRSIERGLDVARRLRWSRWERIEVGALVDALSSQGRFEWARALLERARELGPRTASTSAFDECSAEVREHERLAEVAYREQRMLSSSSSEASEHWERALARASRDDCPSNARLRRSLDAIRTRLARVALDRGRLHEAERRLDAIDLERASPRHRRGHRLLRAELALARGDLEAAQQLLEALDPSSQHEPSQPQPPLDAWRRLWLEARVHRARGRPDRAIEQLTRAQAELGRAARDAGTGVEADRFVAMRRESSQLLVRLLLEQGLVEPALCAARMARIRGRLGPLAATPSGEPEERFAEYGWFSASAVPMDERLAVQGALDEMMTVAAPEAATLRCEDLIEPGPGELSLMPFEDAERWVVFAWNDRGTVRARPLATGPLPSEPNDLGERLLGPVDDLLAEARRLRIVTPPSLHDVPMPELTWRGAPVGDAMTVAYAIDGPSAPRGAPTTAAATLVFSDPRNRLDVEGPALTEHFETWGRMLDEHGLAVTSMPPSAERPPSLTEVLRNTADVELAILYGFGATHPSRYLRRPTTRVPDPARVTFDLGATGLLRTDVLSQHGRVPRHVIMAHCDSATVDPLGVSGAVGLAQTYVRAGSEWAIGTAGTVEPNTMLSAVDELVDAYVVGSDLDDVAKALRKVEHRLASEHSNDVGTLRLWIP